MYVHHILETDPYLLDDKYIHENVYTKQKLLIDD